MKKAILIFILCLSFSLVAKSQTRFFEFTTACGHGDWRDSSFIAATSDQTVIDTVLANLARPFNQRKFISGSIDTGNGGCNHNASHWFLWHFIPGQWTLTDLAIELCDGCPYSDVDLDTAEWIGNIGEFCPWSGKPVREVSDPTGFIEPDFGTQITLYPNPASDKLILNWNNANTISISIYNSIGQEISTTSLSIQNKIIDISNLQSGIYFLKITDGSKSGFKKFVVE